MAIDYSDTVVQQKLQRVQAAAEAILPLLGQCTKESVQATLFCSAPASGGHPAINSWKLRPIQRTALGSMPEGDAKFFAAVHQHRDTIELILSEFGQVLFDYVMLKTIFEVHSRIKAGEESPNLSGLDK